MCASGISYYNRSSCFKKNVLYVCTFPVLKTLSYNRKSVHITIEKVYIFSHLLSLSVENMFNCNTYDLPKAVFQVLDLMLKNGEKTISDLKHQPTVRLVVSF